MSSTNTNKSSDFHSDPTVQNKDIRSGDYDVRHGADKEKSEKTTITLEKKKEKDTDKNMKDVHKQDKDTSSSSEGKGIMNTIKDKVRDVLGSGDNDKQKDMDKEKHSEHNKNAGFTASSGSDKQSNLGAGHQQHTANLGATTSSDKDKYSNLGSSSSGQYSGVGSSGSSGQYSGMGVNTSSDKFSTDKHSNLSGDKHSSSAAHSGPATINRTGLGAEHRELGYENDVIPSKEKDYGMQNRNVEYHSGVAPSSIDKDKDSAHKVDLHASLKTGSAAGSTSGSQASTYKTTESK